MPWFDFDGAYNEYAGSSITRILLDAESKLSGVDVVAEAIKPAMAPDTIVYVTGDTYEWKDQIKDYGKRYGNYRYWDRKAEAWRIKYEAWEKLTTDLPQAEKSLKLKEV